jgi:multidrug/hemolysin transport system ATP-binding protein
MNKIIEVEQLSKTFGTVKAIDDISFYVEEGSLFSFLGTNGAGKSTTISILLTLLKQDKGTIRVNGYTVGKHDDKIRKDIGIVFQDSLLDPLLTVKENLHIRGSFYNMSKKELDEAIINAVVATNLTEFLNRPYGKLSGGERRRTDIARALIHKPSILVLDEPTTGLDAQSRKNIWETILRLQAETKMTVFLTTHYIEEAAESDYVVVMNRGKIIAKGTPEQLKGAYSSHKLTLIAEDHIKLKEKLLADHYNFIEERAMFHLILDSTTDAIPILTKYADSLLSFEVKMSNLDDVFLTITGKDENDNAGIY